MSRSTVHLLPKVEQGGNVRVITLTADKVRDVENMIARELEGRTDGLQGSHLLLDFINVSHLSSVELGTVVTLHRRMKACGGRLTLFNLNAEVYQVFTAAHLQTLLEICREGRANPYGSDATPVVIKAEAERTEESRACNVGDPDKFVYCE